MKPQRQPSPWACLATSFAIVLDVDVQELFNEIGHDGSELMATLPEPYCRRAHHVQELIDCCDRRGFAVTAYEAVPVSSPSATFEFKLWDRAWCVERFFRLLGEHVGVVTGYNPNGGAHAWAWNGIEGIDPALGRAVPMEGYSPQYFYALRAVQPRKIPIDMGKS